MRFNDKLLEASRKNKSWLCVGLDPDPGKIPDCLGEGPEAILEFNKAVIESTSDLVCVYKPNSAFYEAFGPDGMRVLFETIRHIPEHIPVILDFKRGDIGNTAAMYARSAFEYYGVDAVTVSPYLGKDSIEPFTQYKDKGIFILCVTSNPSSVDIQKQLMIIGNPPSPDKMTPQDKAKSFAEFLSCSTMNIYTHVSRLAMEWNANDNIGLVIGAPSPRELENIRTEVGDDMPFLIPGVGSQGGDLEKAVAAGSNPSGKMAIINISRGIIYAGNDSRFKDDIRHKAEYYRDAIDAVLKNKG